MIMKSHEPSSGRSSFAITKTRTSVVAPMLPMRDHWLPLSNIDLYMGQVETSVFICYDKPDMTFESVVATLKKALAETLVTYYIFAGEIVKTSSGEPEVLCSNRGVDFTEAHADVELCELDLHRPDESIGRGKLVPNVKNGVFAVQVTELKCGGVAVTCTFDHILADAYSTNMFLVSWSEKAMSKKFSLPPSFRRSALGPRRPPTYRPYMDRHYIPASAAPSPDEAAPFDHHTSRIYHISADQVLALQAAASTEDAPRTKFESFSSFLWQLLAKNANQESNKNNGKSDQVTLAIVVDGRTRIIKADDSDDEVKLMASYFGNLISIPCGRESVADLSTKPVSWVAGRIEAWLKETKTRDHFLDLLDLVEINRPGGTKLTCLSTRKTDGPTFMVSSGQRFPAGKLDFGWGRPRVGSYYFPWQTGTGYVMPVPVPSMNGDWVVYAHLPKDQIDFIEQEAADVLKPFTFGCVPI